MRRMFHVCTLVFLGCGDDPAGTGWQALLEERPAAVLRAWGTSADDVYVTGAALSDTDVMLQHFDGHRWSAIDTPKAFSLWWITAVATDDIRIVGDAGIVLAYTPSTGEVERRETPTDHRLFGVWGSSSTDVWYVGGDTARGEGVILHDDGTTIEAVDHAVLDDATIFKVQGFAADAVWFVGQAGTALFWDGSDLTLRAADTPLTLLAVHGYDADHVFAAGGGATGVLLAWDGTEWQEETPDETPQMTALWTVDEGLTYAAGFNGRVYRRQDGAWSEWVDEVPTFQDIHAVWQDDVGGLWLAGGRLAEDPPTGGVLLHYGEHVSTRGLK